jgi:hypothetical protein
MDNNFYYNITLIAPTLVGEPALHHYVSMDSYDNIRSEIAEACAQLGIEKQNKAPHGFKCSSFKFQHLIVFEIEIYSDRQHHIIEFRQLSGDDRFAFAELLYSFQEQLNHVISGARHFENYDEFDSTNAEQMYDFMKEFADSDEYFWQIDAFQLIAECSRQLKEHNVKSESDRFVSSTSQVVLKGLLYPKAYLYLVSSLADYFSIPTEFDTDIVEKAKNLTLSQSIETLGFHERRETIRLALALKRFYTQAELEQFDTALDTDRILNQYLIKLFAE